VRELLRQFGFRMDEVVYAPQMAARYLPHLPWKEQP
jgi:hypothetical protein